MIKPWKTWLVFGLCCLVLLAAMGWISVTTLRLDNLQQHAAERADLEERVRLALWRMDSWLTPIMVEENSRPASAYLAFAPTEQAYTKSLAQVQQGDVLLPSTLLTYNSSNIQLHFQLDTAGALTSPQVPPPAQNALANRGFTTPLQIQESSNRLEALRHLLQSSPPADFSPPSSYLARNNPARSQVNPRSYSEELFQITATASNYAVQLPGQNLLVGNSDVRQFDQQQSVKNALEFNSRANVYEQARQQAFDNRGALNLDQPLPVVASPKTPGMLHPAWLGNELVLVRRVQQPNRRVVQGLWFNWTNLQASLLNSIKDILPNATLEPLHGDTRNTAREARALAVLPIRLDPGPIPVESTLAWTPVQTSLALAWICVLLAGVAAASLLRGTLSLSERRAAFVSAVTHELRTPLTTFKMYSEMLADGMVPDEHKRRQYLTTLCSEANRLNHLVENVLAYARLERGSARSRKERITLGELVNRVTPRLAARADQAGLQLVQDVDAIASNMAVEVDVSLVEQILFNLVDNACKYAAPKASTKVIHLEAVPENGKYALLRVRDHGQGISAEVARRMFQPFNKSAIEAAHSAPGVGLGLALCRRLSRSMGGDLVWESGSESGACFLLQLPEANSAR